VAGDDAEAIGVGAILAELAFAIETGDLDFDTNDRSELAGNEILWSVAHGPSRRAVGPQRFVVVGELADETPYPIGVVVDSCDAVGVDDLVVPGRHDTRIVSLRCVPGG
jgi:hypothetical protein